jgi:hypothetical protein
MRLLVLVLLWGCALSPNDACHDACETYATQCGDHKADNCEFLSPGTTSDAELIRKGCTNTPQQACEKDCRARLPSGNNLACEVHFVSCEGLVRGKCFTL